MTPELQAVIDALVDDDMRALATPQGISAGTTQNDYGYYLSLIARLVKDAPLRPTDKGSAMLWALVLIEAGANEQGVKDAIRVSY